jgi:hypothetical protein|tara:strand:+ start:1133 stop:1408 length:276 start_codon:yes stop_codon:yes gene_type:complete
MVMNEKEVREQCVKLAEMAGRLAIEVKGLAKENEILKDYIDNIAAIIHYQCALKEQDLWLKDMIREGYYNPKCDKGNATDTWPCFCVECLG